MCGRYTLHLDKAKLERVLPTEIPETYAPDFNISPGQSTLTLQVDGGGGFRTGMLHWGLKTPQNFLINARIETADTTPRFRDAWAGSRCLLPANGFYEWSKDGGGKQPYYIYPEGREVCFLAGLALPAAPPGRTDACMVLTTRAAESIEGIHHRMPVLLDWAEAEAFLRHQIEKRSVVRCAARRDFGFHPVSSRVNSPRNKDAGLIQATQAASDAQLRLF